jgi:hypothetical protein
MCIPNVGMGMSNQMPWIEWTHEAIRDNPDLPNVSPGDPSHTCLYEWTSEPGNWFPEAVIDRLTEADDMADEYANVVFETIENAAMWDNAPAALPPWFGSDYHVTGEMYQLSSRLVKGSTAELRAREWAEEVGYTVLTTDEAIDRTPRWDNVTDMENDDVDFMTEDGTTWQVKSSEPDTYDADRLLVVSSGEVEEC